MIQFKFQQRQQENNFFNSRYDDYTLHIFSSINYFSNWQLLSVMCECAQSLTCEGCLFIFFFKKLSKTIIRKRLYIHLKANNAAICVITTIYAASRRFRSLVFVDVDALRVIVCVWVCIKLGELLCVCVCAYMLKYASISIVMVRWMIVNKTQKTKNKKRRCCCI